MTRHENSPLGEKGILYAIVSNLQNRIRIQKALFILFILCFTVNVNAQPPSHDPSTMIRNTDGRYWIFTTGDGVWAMSSSNANFTDWRVEPTPFAPGTWPGWINNYVSGFGGFFWAPDVIKIGSYYYLYYSCAGNGAAAAIGVTRATNLAGPWTDLGMVVAGNNAIDPALYMDNGRLWMTWGNWQSGIDITEINTSNGKRTGNITHLVSGQVEGPGLIKNGCYYYLFYQRGLCCNGLSSSYYMVVARSTSITGPYTGERTFLANRSGNEHGPGHFGYGEGKLTYHYYAVNDNGNAKLAIKTLGWSGDWPVANGSGGWTGTCGGGSSSGGTYYQLTNRGTNLKLDGMGRTSNGSDVGQWSNTSHVNSQWTMESAGGNYYKLKNRGTGLYLDGMGRTTNGDAVGVWSNSSSYNQQWERISTSGYYQFRNRATGLYLDGMGRTTNGDACGQWANTSHVNSQWAVTSISSAIGNEVRLTTENLNIYPNPNNGKFTLDLTSISTDDKVRVEIYSYDGKNLFTHEYAHAERIELDTQLESGLYVVKVKNGNELITKKITLQ